MPAEGSRATPASQEAGPEQPDSPADPRWFRRRQPAGVLANSWRVGLIWTSLTISPVGPIQIGLRAWCLVPVQSSLRARCLVPIQAALSAWRLRPVHANLRRGRARPIWTTLRARRVRAEEPGLAVPFGLGFMVLPAERPDIGKRRLAVVGYRVYMVVL
ncbi:MAG: hypothetical protein ABSA91_17450, partial [Acidimicrobiales bacterium]